MLVVEKLRKKLQQKQQPLGKNNTEINQRKKLRKKSKKYDPIREATHKKLVFNGRATLMGGG